MEKKIFAPVYRRAVLKWIVSSYTSQWCWKPTFPTSSPHYTLTLAALLISCQDDVNKFMATTFKKISAQALYTSIPQLISRITHDDVSVPILHQKTINPYGANDFFVERHSSHCTSDASACVDKVSSPSHVATWLDPSVS